MTLKEMCKYLKENQEDSTKNAVVIREFNRSNKGNYHFQELEESDIIGLRKYLLCVVIANYEYLADLDKVKKPEWLKKYRNTKCRLKENDVFEALLDNPFCDSKQEAYRRAVNIYNGWLSKSVKQFKKRGIACTEYDYTV